ncbi:MAG: beta family protein [Nitrosomonadales bacterium]|nr:beta family protein [Nitrosomonadales bacterium]
MTITVSHYVPILKWRQGEYQALSRLDEEKKSFIVPLIVIPPVEYDFEETRPKKTVQEHVETFPKRLLAKWGKRKALIDIHNSLESASMDGGARVIDFIFAELRKNGCIAVPVVKLSRTEEFTKLVKHIVNEDKIGVCIRITLPELMSIELNSKMQGLVHYLGLNFSQVDLVIDLEQPKSFEPYPAFSKALTNAIGKIADLNNFRSLTLAATSVQLSAIKKPGGELTRHEWGLYQQLATDLKGIRVPSFGDYAIESPEFLELDMRHVKPAGKIVYTGDGVWFVPKGTAFRGNESQMTVHCQSIVDSVHWCGSGYSSGDKRISDTLSGAEGTGNLTVWKQVGVSHHLVKVVEQLATFHAS